ncbi:hypothetical protein R84981_001779 [Carnimonas sp. R-84981]|uniref:integrase core domain-containing protein n=1 Tax=Carnimonas bestiolae TaxID=3402172 RepID=UPI003EDB8EA5
MHECLNRHWFRTLDEARVEIDIWRDHYNRNRPHNSLNYLSPAALLNRRNNVEIFIESVVLTQGKVN